MVPTVLDAIASTNCSISQIQKRIQQNISRSCFTAFLTKWKAIDDSVNNKFSIFYSLNKNFFYFTRNDCFVYSRFDAFSAFGCNWQISLHSLRSSVSAIYFPKSSEDFDCDNVDYRWVIGSFKNSQRNNCKCFLSSMLSIQFIEDHLQSNHLNNFCNSISAKTIVIEFFVIKISSRYSLFLFGFNQLFH